MQRTFIELAVYSFVLKKKKYGKYNNVLVFRYQVTPKITRTMACDLNYTTIALLVELVIQINVRD